MIEPSAAVGAVLKDVARRDGQRAGIVYPAPLIARAVVEHCGVRKSQCSAAVVDPAAVTCAACRNEAVGDRQRPVIRDASSVGSLSPDDRQTGQVDRGGGTPAADVKDAALSGAVDRDSLSRRAADGDRLKDFER